MFTYLDNAATTKPLDSVIDEMDRIMRETWGNPSAMHSEGVRAENILKESRKKIAHTLGARDKEIIFTSGGTESNNTLIKGIAATKKRQGNHIITTCIEHPAVLNPVKELEASGYEGTYLGVDKTGRIDPDELRAAIREDTILVSIMHINNEIGTIQPIEEAGRIIRESGRDIVFHVDAIQSYGKLHINPKRMGIDALSVSGHKIHGPKGVGFLYLRDGVRIDPLIYGGGQEGGLRSGTENVPAIGGLGIAAEELCRDIDSNNDHCQSVKRRLVEGLSDIEGVSFNGAYDKEYGSPSILNIAVEGVRSEVLLHSLEERDIYVSAGSACSSHHRQGSDTLRAIGLDPKLMESCIRLSFCAFTTEEEIDYTISVMSELIPALRRFKRK